MGLGKAGKNDGLGLSATSGQETQQQGDGGVGEAEKNRHM